MEGQREIKFRVWDVGRKEMWVHNGNSHLVIHADGVHIPWLVYSNVEMKRLITGDPNAIFNAPGILMQFTGLKDKNGKEIYEKDLLMQRFTTFGVMMEDGTKIPGFTGAGLVGTQPKIDFENIIVMEDICQILPDEVMYGKCTYEVIGNIYQNPELL